jgi:hypothetical protein
VGAGAGGQVMALTMFVVLCFGMAVAMILDE